FLAGCRTRRPSWQRDGLPFAGIQLARSDIEWLLATHEDQGLVGPVVQDWVDEDWVDEDWVDEDWVDEAPTEGGEDDPQVSRWCLDLRGARLADEDLSALPLDSTWGGLWGDWWDGATAEQRDAAAVHLEGADLHDVWLRDAHLCRAHLERANLRGAHL